MTRIEVGRCCFLSSKCLYILICLLGCTLQITEISINFFKFQVVSNLEMLMPGKERMRATTICVPNHQIINDQKYQDIVNAKIIEGSIPSKRGYRFYNKHEDILLSKRFRGEKPTILLSQELDKEIIVQYYLTIKERLEITIDVTELLEEFNYIHLMKVARKFILSECVCYQMMRRDGEVEFQTDWGIRPLSMADYSLYEINSILLENVTILHIVLNSISQSPFIEFFLQPQIKNFNWTQSAKYSSAANSFKVTKLEWPFVDNCIKYLKIGFKDNRAAINNCINEKSIERLGKAARFKEFDNETAVDYPMIGYPLEQDTVDAINLMSNECKKIYHQPDCDHETIFTRTTIDSKNSIYLKMHLNMFRFSQSMSENPSYKIQSQPKIENVDFLTYILGAFSTWFGFSFIFFNPANYVSYQPSTTKLSTISMSDKRLLPYRQRQILHMKLNTKLQQQKQ